MYIYIYIYICTYRADAGDSLTYEGSVTEISEVAEVSADPFKASRVLDLSFLWF